MFWMKPAFCCWLETLKATSEAEGTSKYGVDYRIVDNAKTRHLYEQQLLTMFILETLYLNVTAWLDAGDAAWSKD